MSHSNELNPGQLHVREERRSSSNSDIVTTLELEAWEIVFLPSAGGKIRRRLKGTAAHSSPELQGEALEGLSGLSREATRTKQTPRKGN